ncbi:phosphoglucosamine mutase, partial [Candidatus Heimdallarchaeota archaeon]
TISTKNKIKEILKIDGLRITFEDDSWVLIRPSGTEPIIRITSQATTKEDVESQLEYYSQVIKKVIKQLK